MAKPAKSDRQAKIDAIRKQQKGADKRRGYTIVAVSGVIAAALIAVPVYGIVSDRMATSKYSSLDLSEIGAAADVCGEITTEPAADSGNHVPQEQQVTYDTAPPAFGPHWNVAGVAPVSGAREFYTADDRPELEALVHNLEHGFTVLWYDETIAEDDDAVAELRGIAGKFSDDSNRRLAFIAAPWTSDDGEAFPEGQHVAMTHWSAGGAGETDTAKQVGAFQYCSEASGAALQDFMDQYPQQDSPEPNTLL
ncbi:hypothetical protein I601_0154 [Nocardioides dokdonensis FR1436]|uniref:DUF3105 domain-containing protein n=1 Tax=Nocardioides dokdonensis FR1436 TaxID=1300347 RepID=A0A1A9GEC5_9ACTN|nr:DUF3105 domain-containing protein [Nocardioides dokdonensis]ANH36608.1 hypothetical protein I601_0154 [Nocardioides dokdonensis FR1436]